MIRYDKETAGNPEFVDAVMHLLFFLINLQDHSVLRKGTRRRNNQWVIRDDCFSHDAGKGNDRHEGT